MHTVYGSRKHFGCHFCFFHPFLSSMSILRDLLILPYHKRLSKNMSAQVSSKPQTKNVSFPSTTIPLQSPHPLPFQLYSSLLVKAQNLYSLNDPRRTNLSVPSLPIHSKSLVIHKSVQLTTSPIEYLHLYCTHRKCRSLVWYPIRRDS